MAFTKYGKIIDITLTAVITIAPLIKKIRDDGKAKEELAKMVAEEVARQTAHRIK